MIVSSRTPEGMPSECPLCGAATNLEFSDPAGDAACPNCGCLNWASSQLMQTLAERFANVFTVSLDKITPDTRLEALGATSLNVVEMVMEFEEEFDFSISEASADQIQTIGDIVRYIQRS